METEKNKSPRKTVISANLLSFKRKDDLMESSSGYIGIQNHAPSLERLVKQKSAIEAFTGGPFRLLQVGHWCNSQDADSSVFVGWHGSLRDKRKKVDPQVFVEKFSKWCFVFEQIKGTHDVNETCFFFAQLATEEWKSMVTKQAPSLSETPQSKLSGSAIRDSALHESKNNVQSPKDFHVVPFVNYALLRNATKHPQIWSVHIAMPVDEQPYGENVSQFFETGVRYWGRTNVSWLPVDESRHCTLSREARELLDGPSAEMEVEEEAKQPVSKAVAKGQNPKFRCTFPSGMTIVVEPDFFRKMFE